MKITTGPHDIREVAAFNRSHFLQIVDQGRKSHSDGHYLQSFTRLMFR